MRSERNGTRATDLVISGVLRLGVLISAGAILLGLALLAMRGTGRPGASLDDVIVFPHSLDAVFLGVAALDPVAIISFGLVLMIATPVIRVAASVAAFVVERDWGYVAITAAVLSVLIVSFALGKAGI